MSSGAWQDYQIPVIPYFIHLDAASGTVISEGVLSSLADVPDVPRTGAQEGRVLPDGGPTDNLWKI